MRRTLAVILTVLLGALAALSGPAAHAVGPVRILITGDSVTQGRHGDYTWRYRLDREFRRQGVPFDFVGSYSLPYVDPGYASASYADPAFDRDHFARAGVHLAQMAGPIQGEVAQQQPDVIVLEAGINDFVHGATADQVDASLRDWIAAARAGKSDVRIILSPVLAPDNHPELAAAIAAYDAQMRATAAELASSASPITVADTTRGWSPATMSLDGIHPTPTGETFYAQRIAEALQAVGILPATPEVYRVVPWGRVERAVAKVAGSFATVSWGHQAVTSGRVRVRRAGGAWSTSALHPEAHVAFPVVPGKAYDVEVQLVRYRMTGPWGPATRFSAAAAPRPEAPAHVLVTRAGVRWSRSRGATSYVVRLRKAHRRDWITRHTHGLSIRAAHVRVAQVRAVGAAGASSWRRGAR